MMKHLSLITLVLLALASCREDVDVTSFEEEPTPTPTPIWGNELYMAATIDGKSRQWTNFDSTGNGIDSAWYTICADTTTERLKGQSAYFGPFNTFDSLAYNTIAIELLDCAPFYEMDIDQDSIIRLGSYQFGSALDTIPGVVISFADDTGKVWSSQFPLDTFMVQPITSKFVITDLLENVDGFSAYTMGGEVECVLYDTNGNSILLTNGSFISRIGRAY